MDGDRHEINGVNYNVSDQGTGERVVLLLHGMPDTSDVWRHQVPALLDAGYRVITPDMLGYGGTDKPADPARYAGENIVGDMLGLIQKLGVENLDVVGHDWGAFASWQLANNFPELVRRHVAISVGHYGVFFGDFSPESLRMNWYMYLNTQDSAVDLYCYNDCDFFIKGVIPTHPDPTEVRDRLKDKDAMRAVLNWDRGNQLADMFLVIAQGELTAQKCAVPTLGIWSSGDAYLLEDHMVRSADFMAADWRYARIDDGSHWPMLDRPDEVTGLILEWLGRS